MQKFLIIILAAAGLFIFTGCVSDFNRLQNEADTGNINSQAKLGMGYMIGGIAPVNHTLAVPWLKMASQMGNPVALYYYGYALERGLGGLDPSPERAARSYQNAFTGLNGVEQKEDMSKIYVLGLLYRYGRGTQMDSERAFRLFQQCFRENYMPAGVELGKMYYQGVGVERSIERAKNYFYMASNRNYPEAQYYLALIYYSEKNNQQADRLLTNAANANYPPAMYELASRTERDMGTVDDRVRKLYLQAGEGDLPRAQYRVYQLMESQQELAVRWLDKAVERSYSPAMFTKAQLLAQSNDAIRSMILYDLIIKTGATGAEPFIEPLDSKCGLYLPIKFVWYDLKSGSDFVIAGTSIQRIITGYHAGIIEGSMVSFDKDLRENYMSFYLGMDWYKMYEYKMPFNWISMIFKAAYRIEQDKPGFWLNYGICAIQAGQGETVMYAAARMKDLGSKITVQPDAKLYSELASLMKATGLVMIGRDEEAYNFIYVNGRLENAANINAINCINFWMRPLLKDKNKFSVATGINEKQLGNYQAYPRTAFYDLELEQEITDRIMVQEPQVKVK